MGKPADTAAAAALGNRGRLEAWAVDPDEKPDLAPPSPEVVSQLQALLPDWAPVGRPTEESS